MATNGLISVVNRDNKVLLKIVVGCDGYNITRTVEHLYRIVDDFSEIKDLEWLRKEILDTGFGCDNCLVIMDYNGNFSTFKDECLEHLYIEKFDVPGFNPRWENGMAAYNIIVVD